MSLVTVRKAQPMWERVLSGLGAGLSMAGQQQMDEEQRRREREQELEDMQWKFDKEKELKLWEMDQTDPFFERMYDTQKSYLPPAPSPMDRSFMGGGVSAPQAFTAPGSAFPQPGVTIPAPMPMGSVVTQQVDVTPDYLKPYANGQYRLSHVAELANLAPRPVETDDIYNYYIQDENGNLVPGDTSFYKPTSATHDAVGTAQNGYTIYRRKPLAGGGGGTTEDDLEPRIPVTRITASGEVSTDQGFVPQEYEYVYPGITGAATNEYKRLIASGMPRIQQTADLAIENARSEYLRTQSPYFGNEVYDPATGKMYDPNFYKTVDDNNWLWGFGGPDIKRAESVTQKALETAIGKGNVYVPTEFAKYYNDNIRRYVDSGVVPVSVARKWAEDLGVTMKEINSLIGVARDAGALEDTDGF